MKEYITGAQLCDMVICAADALNRNKQSINELNVFPVPDGDTGTNMFLTMATAAGDFRKKRCASMALAAGAIPALSSRCCSGAFQRV